MIKRISSDFLISKFIFALEASLDRLIAFDVLPSVFVLNILRN